MAPDNSVREIVRQYLASYESGSDDVLACLSEGHRYHGPAGAAPLDLAGRTAETEAFCAAFGQIHVTVQDLIVEGDAAAARVLMQATHTGDFHGIPPTGRRIDMRYIEIIRVREGKIQEEWSEFDLASMINQLR